MRLFPRMWSRAPEAKGATLEALLEYAGAGGAASMSGVPVTREAALMVGAWFCGVRAIAEGVAQVPIRVRREETRGDTLYRVPARSHWAHRLLVRRPNGWMTSFEFREYMTFAAVMDRGGLAIKNTVKGEVRELLPVPMGSWQMKQGNDWRLSFTVTFSDGTLKTFDQRHVMYLRGPSTDTFSGLQVYRLAREALGLASAIEGQQARLAGRGGNPSGVLSFDGQLKPETKELLRRTWSERYGPGGTGGIAVLDQAAKFAAISQTAADSQALETRRFQIEEIARHLRVLPIMLMQADKASTFASAEQMFLAHVMHTLGPWVRRWEEVLRRDVLPATPPLVCDLVERTLLRGNFSDMAGYYASALGAGGGRGWVTQNEAREEMGLDPVADPQANTLPMGAMEAAGQQKGTIECLNTS